MRLAETVAGDLRAERQAGEREDVADNLTFDFAGAIARDPRDREHGIGRQALLDEIGLGQRQLVISGLKPLVVEQCDLHGGLDAECSRQQLANARVDRAGSLGRPHEGDILFDGLARQLRDGIHAAVGRECGAARQSDRSEHEQALREMVCHGALLPVLLGLRRDVLVALAPRRRSRRPQAGVRRNCRTIAGARDLGGGIGRISAGDLCRCRHAAGQRQRHGGEQ